MDIKIDGKTITLKDKMTIGDFRKMGKMPSQADFDDPMELLNGDWIYNLLERAGWTNINDCELGDLMEVVQNPVFADWMANFFIDSKKVKTSQV